jgi:hypothetical protein
MKLLFSIFIGIASAISATLIHQSLPPFGVILAIFFSYLGIWWLGRLYDKRRYKFVALLGWLVVIAKAGSFGVGNELLIQGDNQGSALLIVGSFALVIALIRRS